MIIIFIALLSMVILSMVLLRKKDKNQYKKTRKSNDVKRHVFPLITGTVFGFVKADNPTEISYGLFLSFDPETGEIVTLCTWQSDWIQHNTRLVPHDYMLYILPSIPEFVPEIVLRVLEADVEANPERRTNALIVEQILNIEYNA